MKLADLRKQRAGALNYEALEFDYERSGDQDAAHPVRRPVVVVGAGPVGLSLAIDLAQREVPVLVLDNDNALSTGSRAICFAKRTLEIFDRLGCGDLMVAKGVSWNVGRVYFGDEQVYQFDLQPESGHERPAFINLQQFYVEGYLATRAAELPLLEVRWRNKAAGVEQMADHVLVTIETPEGQYQVEADYVVACDGARSTVRQLLGQESRGRVFRDRFLIADVKMKLEQPPERWFWFDPPFHRNQSVLLHMQPDGVWRIDFQLGWDADPEKEKRPENIIPRVRQMLAHTSMKDAEFELAWASVYTFACLRMDSFRHGRIFFAGDAAHGVSPFGARGANSGVQDAENLAWKLAAVLQQRAPDALLDTYAAEREHAADENIRQSTRSTDFITPKSAISRVFRDAVLELSKTHAFARMLVNSGRLSVPTTLHQSPLNTPSAQMPASEAMVPGAAATDAPVQLRDGRSVWLLRQLGQGFTALVSAGVDSAAVADQLRRAAEGVAPLKVLTVASAGDADADLIDAQGLLAQRYALADNSVVLLRPDQHVCARWSGADTAALRAALRKALAFS
ncbi:FAD-dependent oxidoreductase [Ramlibacter rhizophilus]|uniref:FAD-dependent oxidoreductase n=1 Tax=Ramlibacter rhizophilus TaxID=1781167 RepID=A0A4Z0BW59_9BURK|nr:FAD-dependent oxidoreductase [Ramlibacter rhizophilus]TFZ03463.1 FAD-dependent oxidoreductase [Ramlibacter rhizophilus]